MNSLLKIIIPKSDRDLEELKKLDQTGKLVSGSSYPTEDQMSSISQDTDSEIRVIKLPDGTEPK